MEDGSYKCEATSPEGFVQQVALYVRSGYLWYVAGSIPAGKRPEATDQKIVAKYGVGISKWARARRKKNGAASLAYLRHGRFFVILATRGEHAFYREEPGVRDVRRVPIKFGGYSLSYRRSTVTGRWHASVRMAPQEYLEVKAFLLERAPHWSRERMEAELHSLPFEPWAPVRQQLLNILRAINRVRRMAGKEPIPFAALHLRRRSVKVFEAAEPSAGKEAA